MDHFFQKFSLSLFLLSFFSITVLAQAKVELPKAAMEQKGFYVRGGAGIASGTVDYVNLFEHSTAGLVFDLKAGQRFSRRVGLHAVVTGFVGMAYNNDLYYEVDQYTLAGLGGGATFWIGKGYAYIMPEIMLNEISTTINGGAGNSNPGMGFNLYGGHDINLGKDFGLGLMAFVHYSSLVIDFPDPVDVTNIFYGFEVSLRFGK